MFKDNQSLMSAWRRIRQAWRPAKPGPKPAYLLYTRLIHQARLPLFYRRLGIPDTPEGRFELLALHAALVMIRLGREGESGCALAQSLFDLMFADMDANLREIGIGDLSVGKHVKRLAGQFYARLDALATRDKMEGFAGLRSMLIANLYHGGNAPMAAVLDQVEACLQAIAQAVERQDKKALLSGEIDLPDEAALSTACDAALADLASGQENRLNH